MALREPSLTQVFDSVIHGVHLHHCRLVARCEVNGNLPGLGQLVLFQASGLRPAELDTDENWRSTNPLRTHVLLRAERLRYF